jgi:cytochrome b561
MTKNSVKKILNPILLVLAINQFVTASIADHQSKTAPIIPDEVFEFVHEWAGYVFVALILLHILLNLDWVKSTYFKRSSR